MQVDVVHALLHHGAVAGVGAAAVHPVDEIVVHGGRQPAQLVHRAGALGALDIGVAQGVGHLGGEPALDGRPADQAGEHRDAGLGLAQRVQPRHRHPVAEQAGIAERLLVVQVAVAHHVQQRPLRCVDLVAVVAGRTVVPLFRQGDGGAGQLQVADGQPPPGKAVVQHQQVAPQQHVGHDGQAGRRLHELFLPGQAQFQALVVAVAQFDLPLGNAGVKHRPQHPAALQRAGVALLKGGAPHQPQAGAQHHRVVPPGGGGQHLRLAAEGRKRRVQHGLPGTVRPQQRTVGIVGPDGEPVAQIEQLPQQAGLVLARHHTTSPLFPFVFMIPFIIPHSAALG